MRKWMRDRMKRRNKPGGAAKSAGNEQDPNKPAPLQPTFLDRDNADWQSAPQEGADDSADDRAEADGPQPEYEAQPEADPQDAAEAEQASAEGEKKPRGERSRRRGRGGRGRRGRGDAAPQPPVVIEPGSATGEAAEVEGVPPESAPSEPAPAAQAQRRKGKAPKGAVVLAIGLPGSGKSSWFRRHNLIPLSSDLMRGLLFDDATEQRFQDLVFSTLRYMLRMRMVAGRPMNYIDATNLSPKERHSWIKMARDFNYEAHAVYFDVPVEVCMERNRKRSRNVPDEVMQRMAAKLRPPKFDEGFSKITIVRLRKPEKRDEEFTNPEE